LHHLKPVWISCALRGQLDFETLFRSVDGNFPRGLIQQDRDNLLIDHHHNSDTTPPGCCIVPSI